MVIFAIGLWKHNLRLLNKHLKRRNIRLSKIKQQENVNDTSKIVAGLKTEKNLAPQEGKKEYLLEDREKTKFIEAQCPECEAVYQVDAFKIPVEDAYARCRKCQTRFFIKQNSSSTKDTTEKNKPTANGADYRVPGEKRVLYISLSCLTFILFVLLKISFGFILILIIISIALVKIRQGQLLGQSVKISEHQFPKVYNAAQIAARRLSMKSPDVFVKMDPVINAYALGFFGKKSVVLHSATVESMNNDELILILGHEFSHIRCHHTNWIVITNSSEGIRIPIFSDIMGFIFLIWSRKAEFTADRGGLLASRNLKASISALSKIAVGEKLYEELNIAEFIDQDKQINDDIISKISQTLSTHPYTVKRLLALEDYYKSRNYKQLIEKGVPDEPDYVKLLLQEANHLWDKFRNQDQTQHEDTKTQVAKLKEEIERLKKQRRQE